MGEQGAMNCGPYSIWGNGEGEHTAKVSHYTHLFSK